jgi:hypothetical protein
MPSVENVVTQVALPLLSVAGFPPVQVRFDAPSLNVTVPVAPDVTEAVRVSELFGEVVNGVVTLGLNDVVLDVDAAVYVMVMSQDVQLMPALAPSSARYKFQLPLTESPVKTPVRVLVPRGAADAMVNP